MPSQMKNFPLEGQGLQTISSASDGVAGRVITIQSSGGTTRLWIGSLPSGESTQTIAPFIVPAGETFTIAGQHDIKASGTSIAVVNIFDPE